MVLGKPVPPREEKEGLLGGCSFGPVMVMVSIGEMKAADLALWRD